MATAICIHCNEPVIWAMARPEDPCMSCGKPIAGIELCPRCEDNHFTPYGLKPDEHRLMLSMRYSYPALSRMDNKTYICSPCGTDEAMRDFIVGTPPIPPSEWPIKELA